MSLEQTFLDHIAAEPENPLHRQIYADWLEEQGDPRGELLRIQEQLRTLDVPNRPQVEQRMHELLNQGVQPLTITRTNSLGMKLVQIFPGQFRMGSPPEEEGRLDNEHRRELTVSSAFWLGQFPVTQGEWEQLMGTTPWRGQAYVKEGEQFPATYVSWEAASEFCRQMMGWQQLARGWEYQLPTEAQWEYACRAGTRTRFSFGNNISLLGQYSWYDENTGDVDEEYAHQVGQKKPNPWNLSDIHGNLWEWCQEWYVEKLPGGTDPWLQEFASHRVSRGGSWIDRSRFCRSACRAYDTPDDRSSHLGFRVALVQTQ